MNSVKLLYEPLGVRCANCNQELAHFFFADRPVLSHPIRHVSNEIINCYPDTSPRSPTCRIKDGDWYWVLEDLLSLEVELR